MIISGSIEPFVLLQNINNDQDNAEVPREKLASQITRVTGSPVSLELTRNDHDITDSPPKPLNTNDNKKYLIEKTKQLASSRECIDLFKNNIQNSGRPLVHFPTPARGDMNNYKYVGFLDENIRPLTIFEYFECKQNSNWWYVNQNNNIPVIREHINSMRDKLQEGIDYIICGSSEVEKLKKGASNRKHYQYYDSILSIPGLRKLIHEEFQRDIDSNNKIKSYLESRLPFCTSEGKFIRKNRLIMVNINMRTPQSEWNPREARHATPAASHMQELVDCVYEAKKNSNQQVKEEKFDIGLIGSKLNQDERNSWTEYGLKKGVNVYFFNDMAQEGLDRIEQRETLFALCDRYKSTIYIGHQSGVNEDAVILPRTNVYSLSEYLGPDQIGISRIEKKSQIDTVKMGPLGIPMHASTMGNFYSVRNTEFLSTEGILAAIQVKLNMSSQNHLPLNKIWPTKISSEESGNTNFEDQDERIVDELLDKILNSVKTKKTSSQDENIYRDAIRIIVKRMKGDSSYLSNMTKEYIINIMKQELNLHDRYEPLTQHEIKREAHNAGIIRYNANARGGRAGDPDYPEDYYLDWILPQE